ncbi:MAG: TonB-dependent receptor [Chitinophagaceae bacterium]|nr:MAG: TonB-dependent receptor [Chitinophagaceae bacterium]
MKSLKPLLIVGLLFAFVADSFGQVTTGSITGSVKDAQGLPLIGATVKATHVPSGTVYGTVTQSNGGFTIPNMRIGGPYKVEISYVGYQTKIINQISLVLGEPYSLNTTLAQGGQQLSEITVVASGGKLNQERTGASTNISSQELATLPSINRSISDFTRITPQTDGLNDFGGRDGRYNNIQVDGVNLNNSFGLSSDLLPGGGASPVSVDALSEISVNIAPFDVRQSDFTGAGINVATKSGTNTFKGSIYGFYRNQNFNGKTVDGYTLTTTPQSHKTFGFNLGGPIIKNKLFFFVNGEIENQSAQGITYSAAGSNSSGNPSSTPVDSLQALSQYLKSKYNYNTGAYQDFPNFVTKNHKILAKADWNISSVHKLTVKYTDFRGSDMSPLNGSSNPTNGKFFVTSQANSLSRLPNNRFSSKSMSFANSNYGTNHVVQTASAELNSNFNSKLSNQFLATYTHINDKRTIPGGQVFPTIDIFNGAGQNQLSAGTDPFTNNNEVINNVLDLTDNFTLFAGAHTFTFGATYEHQRVGNMFMGGSNSYYIYNSLNDFLNDAPPVYYGLTYAYYGQSKVFSANLKYGQTGLYAQDECQVNNKLKLTLGIRADMPVYGTPPISNPAITALSFPNSKGEMEHFNTGKWPKTSVYLSPRVGFRWDAMGDKSLILRGGTGIFTGKIPLVWLTNMPSNNGMYQSSVYLNTPAAIAQKGIVFNPDPNAYKNLFPQAPNPPVAPQSFVLIDPKFKFPEVWRTDLGADKSLGYGFTASADLEFTKDIHAVRMVNVNLMPPTGTLSGLDPRPYYPSTQTGAALNYYPNLGQEILLENTPKGYSMFGTIQISKSFSNGFYGSIAYTYTKAEEVSPNPGSRATSAWQSINNVGPTNDPELGGSEYATPSRLLANLSYHIEYVNHMATTISLFYQGMSLSNYSYVYNGSIVGDGNQQLMYIYKSGADVPFINITDKSGNIISTIAQQQAAYDQFINSSPYLKKHKGKYADRYTALTPWFNQLDMRILQDFFVKSKGGTRHTIEISLDMINLPNLISSKWKNWGYSQMYTINNPLIFKGVDSKGQPEFQMNKYSGQLATQAFTPDISSSRVWGMQLGLRYSF